MIELVYKLANKIVGQDTALPRIDSSDSTFLHYPGAHILPSMILDKPVKANTKIQETSHFVQFIQSLSKWHCEM